MCLSRMKNQCAQHCVEFLGFPNCFPKQINAAQLYFCILHYNPHLSCKCNLCSSIPGTEYSFLARHSIVFCLWFFMNIAPSTGFGGFYQAKWFVGGTLEFSVYSAVRKIFIFCCILYTHLNLKKERKK